MIALVDVKGRRLYNSPACKRILGYSAAKLGETSAFEQIHPDDHFRVLDAAREAREMGAGKRLEYRIKHKDGSWRVLESVASTIRDAKGEVGKLVIVNRDITERKRAEEQLQHNLVHDPLTNLSNRRLFLDPLKGSFERTRDGARLRAIMCCWSSATGLRIACGKTKRWLVARAAGHRRRLSCSGWAEMNSRCCSTPLTILAMPCAWPRASRPRSQSRFFVETREMRVSASIGIALEHGHARTSRGHSERCGCRDAPGKSVGRIAL